MGARVTGRRVEGEVAGDRLGRQAAAEIAQRAFLVKKHDSCF